MAEYKMPSLGADMEDAILIEWKVKEGDRVEKGDIIAEIETEKGDIDVEVYESGVVQKIIAQPGQRLPVGSTLAIIQSEGEQTPSEELAPPPPPMEKEEQEHPERRVKASPLAKRVAQELGVDIRKVPVTNEESTIHKADVEQYYELQKTKEKEPISIPQRPKTAAKTGGMRHAIAMAMSRSNRDIPHYYLETSVDMSAVMDWLQAENQKRSVKERLLLPVILLKAVAKALNDVPALNAYWQDDRSLIQEAINVGFAISLRNGGLVIPAIHHVDIKSLDEIMQSLTDLTKRSRTGKLKSSELTDGTVTVTYLGDRGVERVYGVIYPPQVALIGFGKVKEQPWAENGMLGVKPVLNITLAGDHRATDGMTGAKFLEALTNYLTKPAEL